MSPRYPTGVVAGLVSHHGSIGTCDITLAPKKLIRTRRASEGSASEPSLARRVSMCKDAKLSCRGNSSWHVPPCHPAGKLQTRDILR